MTNNGYENLRRYYADPANAAARAERARLRFIERKEEIQRKSLAARRGCDVPPELEPVWRELKRKRISNREVARVLGLKWSPRKSRSKKGVRGDDRSARCRQAGQDAPRRLGDLQARGDRQSGRDQMSGGDRTKFGYEHAREIEALEREVAVELGRDPSSFDPEVYFGARRRYEERHRGEPTYRQRQEAARVREEKWVAPAPNPNRINLSIDREEIAYLIDRLDGMNDPIGASALAKLKQALLAY